MQWKTQKWIFFFAKLTFLLSDFRRNSRNFDGDFGPVDVDQVALVDLGEFSLIEKRQRLDAIAVHQLISRLSVSHRYAFCGININRLKRVVITAWLPRAQMWPKLSPLSCFSAHGEMKMLFSAVAFTLAFKIRVYSGLKFRPTHALTRFRSYVTRRENPFSLSQPEMNVKTLCRVCILHFKFFDRQVVS